MNIYQIMPSLKILRIDQAKEILTRLSKQPSLFKLSPKLFLNAMNHFLDQTYQMISSYDHHQAINLDLLKTEIQNLHKKYYYLIQYIEKQEKLFVSLSFPFDLMNTNHLSLSFPTNDEISSQMQVTIHRISKKSKNTNKQGSKKYIILDQFHLNLILQIDPILHKKIGDTLDDGDDFT